MSASPGDERLVAVHPNSMAARKWGRTEWTTRTDVNLWARAAGARKRGEYDRAKALRAAAARAAATEHYCG